MGNTHNIFFSELTAHLETLEKNARKFCHISYKDKMITSAAALNNIDRLLRDYKTSHAMRKKLSSPISRDYCLGILCRIHAVLILRYLPNCTGELRELTEQAVFNVRDCLINQAWY